MPAAATRRLKTFDSLRVDRPGSDHPERAYFVSYAGCPAGRVRVRNQSRGKYETVPREWVRKCRWVRREQMDLL